MVRLKKVLLGVVAGAALAGAGLAHAGSVSTQSVSIFTTGGLDAASGGARATRNTSDTVSYIGCVRFAYDTGSTSALCYARNPAGTIKQCSTSDPAMVASAETMNPMSFLYFVVNTDGSCNRVIVTNTSFNL